MAASINISSGNIGDHFQAHRGSVVNISGGTVGEEFDAFAGSRVNISGGVLGDDFEANDGSVVNITGGVFLQLGDLAGLKIGTVAPLRTGTDKIFDAEIGVQFTRAY